MLDDKENLKTEIIAISVFQSENENTDFQEEIWLFHDWVSMTGVIAGNSLIAWSPIYSFDDVPMETFELVW